MKNVICCLVLVIALPLSRTGPRAANVLGAFNRAHTGSDTVRNLFIITIDGFRWQELFKGADRVLINDPRHTADTATMKMLYWAETAVERRRRLMPFFWSVIASRGQLFGNRTAGSRMNTSNIYNFSYPGYNEIFTGTTDLLVSSNSKSNNPNPNVLEYLNSTEAYRGKVVAFTSWDVFPFILNEQRCRIPVNSGYEDLAADHPGQELINRVQADAVYDKGGTRHDQLTFLAAKEYIRHNQPKVVLLGFGETDEYAHAGRYDMYLEQANQIDRMIGELWHLIQSTPGYKDNSSLVITTDHGRGTGAGNWASHSSFIRGSSQTWLGLLGPDIAPRGEVKEDQQLYQEQIAGLISGLVGENFNASGR